MKIYNLRVSKKLRATTAAFFAVILYLLIVIVLNLLQSLIDPSGEEYNLVYGVIQFLVATVYWVIYNYLIFSREGKTSIGAIITYLVFNLFPIIVFTIATAVIVYFYPTTEFTLSWNLLTWIIAPTIFWFLPYSYIYYTFGYYINIPIYMGLMLIYIVLVEIIGIILGLARRAHIKEKEEEYKKQRERSRQMRKNPQIAFESVQNEEAPPTSVIIQPTEELENQKLFTGTNPFSVLEDEENLIFTEAFEPMDEEIIDKAHNETEIVNIEVDSLSKQAQTYRIDTESIDQNFQNIDMEGFDMFTEFNQDLDTIDVPESEEESEEARAFEIPEVIEETRVDTKDLFNIETEGTIIEEVNFVTQESDDN